MKVNRKDLIEQLKQVMPALGAGETNPNNVFSFFTSGSYHFISTTNEEVAILKKTDIVFADNISVRGTELFNVLKTITEDEVDVFANSDKLTVASSNSTTHIATTGKLNYFISTINYAGGWNELPADFGKKLELCAKACAKNGFVSDILPYVYADNTDIVGADGNQILWAKLEKPVTKMFIKNTCAKTIAKVDPKYYKKDDGWLMFCHDNSTLYAVRTVSDKERYPFIVTKSDWTEEELTKRSKLIIDNLFNVEGGTIKLKDKQAIINGINACIVFTKDMGSENKVRITIKDNKLTMQGIGKYGAHQSSYEVDSPLNCVFVVCPYVLMSAVKNADSVFTASSSTLLIVNDEFKQVVSLQRG